MTDISRTNIDAVYTWVNHNDDEWKKLYKKELFNNTNIIDSHQSAANIGRFINRNELYYSILSIHKYAPWIRNIFILTNCKIPSHILSLNKVIPINHTEVFKTPSNLPTFNSRAIESNLHRILGLSDHFLYFNDDVFLCAPVIKSDFFPGINKINIFPSKHEMPYKKPISDLRPAEKGMLNAANLLKKDYNYLPKFKLHHAPFALLKKVLYEIESRYRQEILNTMSHRFRHPDDIPMATTMHAYYCAATGVGTLKSVKARYIDINSILFPLLTNRFSPLRRGHYQFLCLNEVTNYGLFNTLQDYYIKHILNSLFIKK